MSNRTLNLIVGAVTAAITTSVIALTQQPAATTTNHPTSIRAPATTPHAVTPVAPHVATPAVMPPKYVTPPTPYKPPVNPAIQNITRTQPPSFVPPVPPQKSVQKNVDYGEFLRQEAALNNRSNTGLPPKSYQDPNNAKISPVTQPSYPLQKNWRGDYYTTPKTTYNNVTGAGSLSTNQATTTNQVHRVGSDMANPVDAAKAAANYAKTHKEDVFMNGASMLIGVGEARVVGQGVKIASEAIAGRTAAKEATLATEKSVAKNATTDSMQAGSIRGVNPTGSTTNCVNCAITTDQMLRGNYASALPSGPKYISEIEAVYGRSFSSPTNISDIASKIAKAGNGSQGIVLGSRGSSVGHVFNVVNQNGVIRFLDGQTKQEANLNSGYSAFQFLITK